MINRKKILLFSLLLVCFTFHYLFAQQIQNPNIPDQYRAIHWSMEDGLSESAMHTMIKDAKGFLWVGSDLGGFCRFDGASFKKYLADQNKRGAINSDKIFSFEEDSLNNIWIGTGKGLSRYDSKADTFTNFSPFLDSAFSKLEIAPFWATKDEVFCMEPGSLITAFNIYTLKRRKLVQLSKEVDLGIHWNTNKSFFDARSNSIWKLLYDGPQKAVLQQIFLENGKTQNYPWPCYRNNVNHRHNAEDIQYDPKRNSIWVNSGDGLLEFSLNDKQFHHIDALNEFVKLKEYDRDVGIDIDRKGNVWLATKPQGILIYDPETETVHPLFSDQDLQKKAGDANLHIYCDREGIVWTSNWQSFGIYELLPSNPSVKRYAAKPGIQDSLSDGIVISIIPAAQNKIWIGTYGGINIFDPITEKFEVLREKDLPGIRGKAIAPVYIDTVRQKVWLDAGPADPNKFYQLGGMYEMDIKTRKCRQITFRDGAKQLDTLTIDPDQVRPYKNGILVSSDHYGVFEIKEGSLFADLVMPLYINDFTNSVTLEEERRLYLKLYNALPNFTFENKNGKWIKVPHLLDSLDWWFMIYNEKDQTHWTSFKYKLVHYDKDFREIKTYGEEDGYTGLAYKMILDNAGNLWFTNILEQVGRLNVATGIITMLSETDGYHKKDFDWAVPLAKDSRGNLYFGTGLSKGNKGLDRIYPEKYFSAPTSSVYLRSLTINQKPFPHSTGVNALEELSLRYNQNTISIETGIIDFYTKGKDNLRYKLIREGKDEEWQYGTAYYNTIRYEGLVPGNYKLVMQPSNAGNEFNGPEKILMITISPPFWQTWWFRIVAILFAAAVLYGFIQYRSRNLKQRNIVLEEKVMQRTNELHNSLAELKTTQDQLIQSEKMASLGELTSGIAHEIKNPLNFINNFSEINVELLTEIEEEQIPVLNETDQAEITENIKTLKKNSEKINQHGKRLDGIVKSMLQHSRLGNINKEPVNINALCDESLKLAYHGFRAKEKTFNASFETRFDPDLPKIMVIPQDFGRVMLNLINNAFYTVNEKKKRIQSESLADALEAELLYKPSVIVSTKRSGNKIIVTVSDNGIGIPPAIINKIFQPFFTTKPTGEGTGLGLSMSYDIITKSHGGELRAKSKEGLGTDFEIILPI